MSSLSAGQLHRRVSGHSGGGAGYDNQAVLGFDHLAAGLDILHSLLSQIIDDPRLSPQEVLALSATVVEAAEGVERVRASYLRLRRLPSSTDAD